MNKNMRDENPQKVDNIEAEESYKIRFLTISYAFLGTNQWFFVDFMEGDILSIPTL